MAEDLDDVTWGLLDELELPQSAQMTPSEAGAGLGMLVKMTRLHDLGLAQLCVPDLVADDDSLLSSKGEAGREGSQWRADSGGQRRS
jgi:hypothetical protein